LEYCTENVFGWCIYSIIYYMYHLCYQRILIIWRNTWTI
jgi:hypothetical protein